MLFIVLLKQGRANSGALVLRLTISSYYSWHIKVQIRLVIGRKEVFGSVLSVNRWADVSVSIYFHLEKAPCYCLFR